MGSEMCIRDRIAADVVGVVHAFGCDGCGGCGAGVDAMAALDSSQVTIKTNLLAELKHQAPN